MRISDWSSDVCSSDLKVGQLVGVAGGHADHGGVAGLELVDRLREQRGLQVAAGRVRGGEEVDHKRALFQRIGQLEGERLASQVGRGRGEGRRVGKGGGTTYECGWVEDYDHKKKKTK